MYLPTVTIRNGVDADSGPNDVTLLQYGNDTFTIESGDKSFERLPVLYGTFARGVALNAPLGVRAFTFLFQGFATSTSFGVLFSTAKLGQTGHRLAITLNNSTLALHRELGATDYIYVAGVNIPADMRSKSIQIVVQRNSEGEFFFYINGQQLLTTAAMQNIPSDTVTLFGEMGIGKLRYAFKGIADEISFYDDVVIPIEWLWKPREILDRTYALSTMFDRIHAIEEISSKLLSDVRVLSDKLLFHFTDQTVLVIHRPENTDVARLIDKITLVQGELVVQFNDSSSQNLGMAPVEIVDEGPFISGTGLLSNQGEMVYKPLQVSGDAIARHEASAYVISLPTTGSLTLDRDKVVKYTEYYWGTTTPPTAAFLNIWTERSFNEIVCGEVGVANRSQDGRLILAAGNYYVEGYVRLFFSGYAICRIRSIGDGRVLLTGQLLRNGSGNNTYPRESHVRGLIDLVEDTEIIIETRGTASSGTVSTVRNFLAGKNVASELRFYKV